jgi:hypothetical protein
MSSSSYSHNFGNCTATWSGIDVKASMDAGMPINVTRTQPDQTFKPTGNGGIVVIEQTDKSGLVTCTIDYSSPAYTLLMAAHELRTVAPFVLYDGDTGRRWYFVNSTIVTAPDISIGVDTAPFSFQWFYKNAAFQPGAESNLNLNVVGS